MKKILLLLPFFVVLLWGLHKASGQNLNPQPNFSTQVLSSSPSLYLNFNDYTTNFRDQISGDTFLNTATATSTMSLGTNCHSTIVTTASSASCTLTATAGDTLIVTFDLFANLSLVTGITDSGGATATLIGSATGTSAGSETWYFANVAAGSHTLTVSLSSAPTDGYPSVQAIDVVGAATSSPIDTYAFNPVATASSSVTSGPITTSTAGEFLVGHVLQYGVAGGTWRAGTPAFSLLPGGYAAQEGGSLVTGAAGSYTFNAISSVSSPYLATIVAVKPLVTTYTSGMVTPRQPGFDSTQSNNTSAKFPYNGFNLAPTTTLGDIEWDVPWTMMVQVDRLNWNRSGSLVLASKGDTLGGTSNPNWELFLQMNGLYSQLCFKRVGNAFGSTSGICTAPTMDAMPNGYNYNILVEDSGTGQNGVGSATNAISLYLNGLEVGGTGNYIPAVAVATDGSSFGSVALSVAGGTGYANSTLFTSTGGGPNCVVAGTMTSVSGVPASIGSTTSASPNYGCTSNPTIVLTSPTGTGAVITATASTQTMNSTAYPLMAPGYVYSGATYGVAGSASSQTPTYVDEFALFPGNLTSSQIQGLYYQTKFYQGLMKALPATPYTLVYDDDSCGDEDNIFALALTIAAQKIGYIRLAGVVDTNGDGVSQAIYRQMLDQAGLANIPMAVPSAFADSVSGDWCSSANASTFNASTPHTTNSYPQAKTMYRQIFANNPTTPVFIMLGGSFRGVADWMQSAADSISPLTGAQMVAQNAANGGAIYAQGLGVPETFTGDNSLEDWTAGQYVVENNGAMPIYWYGGAPQSIGPGVLSTRTSKDPFFLAATAATTDVRQGYDSLLTQSFLSNLFVGGVTVAIGGSGTGYAAQTPFTSTGGGPNCVVTGTMVSVGGVPSSITTSTGTAQSSISYEGLGSGCFTAASPPTIVLTAPTGTGAVLTATTTASPCGTVTITAANAGSTSTATCSNHYFLPMSLNAAPGFTPIMEWFLNSLIDPIPSGAPRRNQ